MCSYTRCSALRYIGWAINATPWPLYPRERAPVPVVHDAGWVPGPVDGCDEKKFSCLHRSQNRTAQPSASRCTQ